LGFSRVQVTHPTVVFDVGPEVNRAQRHDTLLQIICLCRWTFAATSRVTSV